MSLMAWLARGSLFVAGGALLVLAGACGDDDSAGSSDAGIDQNIINPPPPPPGNRDAGVPPEGIDTTGRLGTAQLVADVKESTEGPSWSATEGVLYFTVPGSAEPLRKLSTAGAVSTAFGASDAGPSYGTASAGSSRVFVTDRNGVTMIDVGDGGAPTSTRRTGGFTQLGDIVGTKTFDASVEAYVADTSAVIVYHFDPKGGVNEFTSVFDFQDAGSTARATGVAMSTQGSLPTLWIAIATDARGAIWRTYPTQPKQQAVAQIILEGTPPNGIAIDEQNNFYIAWARGIDVYSANGTKLGSTPGLGLQAAPTNLAFGGADRRTLYVTTAAGKIYAIPSVTTGVLR